MRPNDDGALDAAPAVRRRPPQPSRAGTQCPAPSRRSISTACPVLGGDVRLLDGVTGMLVGVDASKRRQTRIVDVPVGATLVASTDGLIERPGEVAGNASPAARRAAPPVEASPTTLCDASGPGVHDRRDDVALIAVRFG